MDRNPMSPLARKLRGRHAVLVASLASALLLAGPVAQGAGGKESSVKGQRNAESSSSSGGSVSNGASTDSNELSRDRSSERPTTERVWEVGAGFETHRLFVQTDLQGFGPDKLFNYYQANASWLPTRSDSVTVFLGAYQRFIADPGETGFRLDDVTIRYGHYFELPGHSQLVTRASVSLPTSFVSYKAGSLGAGRLTAGYDKAWGKYVNTTLRVNGTGFLQQYDSPRNGATPNPLAGFSASVGARVRMPFHAPLTIGVEGYTGYTWFLRPQSQPQSAFFGAVADPQYSQQPITQSYGGEVYVAYELPEVSGVKADLHLAVAEGDPALGYNSLLHDGVSHTYLYFRESSEFYASLSLRY